MDKKDRQSINELDGLASGAPGNSADAPFSSQGSRWTKTPTLISVPNQKQYQHRDASRPSRGSNPFDRGRFHSSIHPAKQKMLIGNPVSTNTPLSRPPKKRRKINGNQNEHVLQAHNVARSHGNGASFNHPSNPIHIDDDDEEDIGQALTPAVSSPDPLTLKSSQPYPQGASSTRPALKSSAPPDGASTQKLKRKLVTLVDSGIPSDEPEEIESAEGFEVPYTPSSHPKKGPRQSRLESDMPTGNVARKKLCFEQPKVVDLKKKSQMMMPQLRSDAITTSTTRFAKDNHPPSRTQAESTLPLEAWFYGIKQLPDEGENGPLSYYVCWDKKSSKLSIKSGEPGTKSLHSTEIQLDRQAKSLQLPKKDADVLVANIETSEDSAKQMRWQMRPYRDSFAPGSRGQLGCLTLKFSKTHHTWSSQIFDQFVKWVSNHLDKGLLRTHTSAGSTAIWESASRHTELSRDGSTEVVSQGARTRKLQSQKPVAEARPRLARDQTPPPVQTLMQIPSEPPKRQLNSFTKTAMVTAEPSRRSTRQTAQPETTRPSPPTDPDELILIYPAGVPGAVNITAADINRLQPGEFLNDTLIEFGLKLWLDNLDKELAESIHVFSSFFYKKLNRKNFEEGYQSVRKWTSKFDLFKKKYIIVPINENLHWYLAIIYHPENILLPPAPPPTASVTTRRRLHQSVEQIVQAQPVPSARAASPEAEDILEIDNAPTPNEARDKATVEASLLSFETSCSITSNQDPDEETNSAGLSPPPVQDDLYGEEPMVVDEDANQSAMSDPTTSVVGKSSTPDTVDSDDEAVAEVVNDDEHYSDCDDRQRCSRISRYFSTVGSDHDEMEEGPIEVDHTSLSEATRTGQQSKSTIPSEDISMDLERSNSPAPAKRSSISATRFYQKPPPKRKGKATRSPAKKDPETEDEVLVSPPLTYIFTLDSLGSRHPQAVKTLNRYLRMEAKDKKGLDEPNNAISKQALVPVQPNYCDCGVYLLHFVEVFMNDPHRYWRTICNKKGTTTMAERQAEWDDSAVAKRRENLLGRIEGLSKLWKAERAAKEELQSKEPTKVDSSDDEIDIVEDVQVTKPVSAKPNSKARRLRG